MWHLETRFSGGLSSAGEQLNSMTLEGFSNPNNSIFLYLVPSKRPCSHPMQKKPPGTPWKLSAVPGLWGNSSWILTCPFRSAGASRSAGAASGPGVPRWPTRSTCCRTGSRCSWGTARGRWWHCGLSLHRELQHRARPRWDGHGDGGICAPLCPALLRVSSAQTSCLALLCSACTYFSSQMCIYTHKHT